MTLPIGEIGAGAISGGAVVAFVMKMLPILMRKFNSKKGNVNNGNPGKAKVCIDRGLKIKEHDIAIKHLCALTEKVDERMEVARKENREDHQRIFDKLDELKG